MAAINYNNIVINAASCEPFLTPILTPEEEDNVTGAVDYKQRPAVRSKTGRWKSAAFLIGVEVAERIAYYGISGNLINFLTRKLGQSTAAAAANVNAWSGVSYMLPVLGAVTADSFLGKYCTIIAGSLLYILGLGLLTLSAVLPSQDCLNHERSMKDMLECSSHSHTIIFFVALYLVALGQSGYRPCVQAFAADQFDVEDPAESKAKSSFFNWWYFGLWSGALVGIGALSYVQDNLSWGLGFGIPCIIMVMALVIFLLGTFTYRFMRKCEGQSPFLRIGRVFILAARYRHAVPSALEIKEETPRKQLQHASQQLRFLDKALLEPDISRIGGTACSKSEVEEAKAILRLFPIWATSLAFAIVFSQTSTFFTKQGVTLDRSIGSNFAIPAASLHSFTGICVVICTPVYDFVLVPVARSLNGRPAGLSMLQRIGTGFFISIICMVVSAVVEKKRLETALKHGLIDLPNVTVPMCIWWLLPQYALFGIAEIFTVVGLQEFFYDQVPNELRTVGVSLYLSVVGVGNFLSSILISVINKATSVGDTETSWFSDNLNRAHLDYFYLLLAGLSAVGMVLFMYFAKSYIYSSKKAHV